MSRLTFLLLPAAMTLLSCGGTSSNSSSFSSASSTSSSTSTSSAATSSSDHSSSSSSKPSPDSVPVIDRDVQPLADRTLSFATDATGVDKSVDLWGLDTAWVSEGNIRRGLAFMGEDGVDVVRVSFTPTAALVNGQLQTEQANLLNQRLDYVELVGANTPVVLNADPPTVDPWFKDANGNTLADRWAQLMDVTAQRCEERGHQVLAAAPFNEPDYSTHQGTQQHFYNVAGVLQSYPRFNNIRLTGGNTLSADAAGPWYEFLKDRLDEGNTHQLNGSFDSYAGFFETVTANGDRAVNDELHNVMEAIVGTEYGMKTGIWWGTAERARGEFVKTSDGVRLGYAEHRPNWTAAAVYRGPDGAAKAFAGASERQAIDTRYRVVVKDRPVYFDGHGPTHDRTLFVPGGTGYWEEQPNAEQVVNITWGDDIQPPIQGRYVLLNKQNQNVLAVESASYADGANIVLTSWDGNTAQQWDFTPLDSRNGQDFSYFHVNAVHSGKAPDVYDFSLDNGGNIVQWTDSNGVNQHWYLEYAGNNWFYVCSRLSAKCLDASNGGGSVVQNPQQGRDSQQWRLVPIDNGNNVVLELDAPDAPAQLSAFPQSQSILLAWQRSSAGDVSSYSVLRSSREEGPYDTLARDLQEPLYIDNFVEEGQTYFYRVRSVDRVLNRSNLSPIASASISGVNDLVARLPFDGHLRDQQENHFHGAIAGSPTFASGKLGNALLLNGMDQFVQLPARMVSGEAMTVSAWVFWEGGSAWQRIFDFGNDQSQNLFLTTAADSGNLRFAINNGDGEQRLEGGVLPTNQWVHVAVTLSPMSAKLLVDGEVVDQSSTFTLSPKDVAPVANYIGRSQFPDALFKGRIDDFRVYNYALSDQAIREIFASSN